ncbi:MAG TPA: ATP-binding protein [Archangium sp.]|nr:ATP-binding protein [Archangium sp.]
MLKRVYADNYKSLLNFEFRPPAVSLLAGRNGSGKTSFFEVLGGLQDLLVWDRGTSVAFPAETLTRSMDVTHQRYELDAVRPDGQGTFHYMLVLEHDRDRRTARIRKEMLSVDEKPLFHCADGEVQLYHDDFTPAKETFSYTQERSFIAAIEPKSTYKQLIWFRTFVKNIWILNLDVRSMAASSTREELFLSRDADNFASWYRFVLQEWPDKISEINESIRRVLPGFRSLKAMASGRAKILTSSFSWPDNPELYEVDFSALSEGQRALIVLYTLLHTVVRQASVVCFDEPDNYVELAEIKPWLVAVSDASREVDNQLLVISHNPEVIDYLAADHAWFFSRPDGGHTRIKPLDINRQEGLKASEWLRGRYDEEQ